MNDGCQFTQNFLNSVINYPSTLSNPINYLTYLAQDNQKFNSNLYLNSFYDTHSTNTATIIQHNSNINIPLIYYYNPYIQQNYGSINTTINNCDLNLSFPLQIPSMYYNNEFSFLNLKRNRDLNEAVNPNGKNIHYYYDKNGQNKNEENIKCLKNENTFNSTENTDIFESDKFLRQENKISQENVVFNSNDEKSKLEDQKKVKRTKIKSKNKKMCKELLEDSFLDHIGETKQKYLAPSFANGQLSIIIDNSTLTDNLGSTKHNNCSKKSKVNGKNNNTKTVKKNQNIKKKNYRTTTVIYHDKDYKKTKNTEDFMKYNFNFHISKREAKKWISYYKYQNVDLKKLNQIIPMIDNENVNNLKPKWLRSKFHGDDIQLNQAINLIQEIYKTNKSKVDEEKCLNLMDEQGYDIEKLINSKCI